MISKMIDPHFFMSFNETNKIQVCIYVYNILIIYIPYQILNFSFIYIPYIKKSFKIINTKFKLFKSLINFIKI